MTAWRTRAAAVVSAVSIALGMVVVGPLPAQALPYLCPPGWTSVTSNPINNITLFCYAPGTSGSWPGADNIYFVKANANAVGQYTRDPYNPTDLWNFRGSASSPNPRFLKKSVRNHLIDYMAAGVQMVINGTFFDCTSNCEPPGDPFQSTLSFPTWRIGLVNAGSNVSVDRRCFAWGNGTVPKRYAWTNLSTTWSGVSGATNDCGANNPYHRVVGLPPNYVVGGNDARTYIGRSISGDPDLICFLAGGDLTNAGAVSVMNDMGCSHVVQMDGGNSSQLSYVDPTFGLVQSPVNGRLPAERPVPHYFVIFG